MNRNPLRTATLVAATFLLIAVPGAARAFVVAGWDFSQYAGDGFLSIDGENNVLTLSANASNFDPTFNVGAESAAFGTLYMDGTFGSTDIGLGGLFDEFVLPTPGSLASNIDAPVLGPGLNPFDSFIPLQIEGQQFTQSLAMIVRSTAAVVFSADLSSVSESGGAWAVSFGARTFSGTSTVAVDFSTDGASYSEVASLELTPSDTPFLVDLGTADSETVFVRLRFAPEGAAQPIFDNVAIELPEPSGGLAIAGVLGTLGALRRVRGPRAAS